MGVGARPGLRTPRPPPPIPLGGRAVFPDGTPAERPLPKTPATRTARIADYRLLSVFGTNGLPLPPVPPYENGRNPAADPSPGSLCTLEGRSQRVSSSENSPSLEIRQVGRGRLCPTYYMLFAPSCNVIYCYIAYHVSSHGQCFPFTGNTLEDNLLGLSPNNLRVVFTGIGYHSCACTLLGGLLGVPSRI